MYSSLTVALLLFLYKAYGLSMVGPFKLTALLKPVQIKIQKMVIDFKGKSKVSVILTYFNSVAYMDFK